MGRFSDLDQKKTFLNRDQGMEQPLRFAVGVHKEEKGLGLGELHGKGLLDGLLEKADFDPIGAAGKRKKKKKGRDQSFNL